MNENEIVIKLELPVASVNKILQVLGHSPFVEVANLITVIKQQGEQQLSAMQPQTQEAPAE